MKTIYIDSDFRCHVATAEGRIAFETDIFDDKCDTFIEGYRVVPEGQAWARSDGVIFIGLMIAPHRSMEVLAAAQGEYEKVQAALAALTEIETALGVSV